MEAQIDTLIGLGYYTDRCDMCGTFNPPSFWTWNSEHQNGISTLHSCACGYTHRVAGWSTKDDLENL